MRTIFRTIAFALSLVICGLTLQAAKITPSKNYITRKVKVGSFNAVQTSTSIDIYYYPAFGQPSVEIYAPDNLMPYIDVTVKGSELVVKYKENMTIQGKHKSFVKVSAPAVAKFTTSSSGNINIRSSIKLSNKDVEFNILSAGDINAENIDAPNIKLRTNSSGNINTGLLRADNVNLLVNSAGDISTKAVTARSQARLISNSAGDIEVTELVAGQTTALISNSAGEIEVASLSTPSVSINANSSGDVIVKSLEADNVQASSSSAGDVEIAGICATATLSAKSSGDVDAKKMKAKDVRATVNSSGDISCFALNSLTATRSGGGEIRYAGNPTNVVINSKRNEGVSPL